MLIDTHCHLYFNAFDDDRTEVLQEMNAAGVGGAIVIGIDEESNAQAQRLAARYDQLQYSVGLHPTSEFPPEIEQRGFDCAAALGKWFEPQPQPIAIGECGIDLHWDTNKLAAQVAVFEAQLAYARERNLPVVVHTREADAETSRILEQVPGARGVLHCFNGSPELLQFSQRANRRGDAWYVSFAGNLTYKRAEELRAAAGQVPLDRLLVETDAPFLAPQAKRGQRNEPAYLVHTATVLAQLRGVPVDEFAQLLTANTQACFGSHWPA
ncbi:TatD family hydrolase [bacterium]|nr:TatD family hydrolase [bacterium]